MRPTARLVVVTGGGGALTLRPGRYVIGRDRACDLVVKHISVSRRHAVIELDETEATLTDLGSRNGTQVEGVKAAGVALESGSTFRIGIVVCRFERIPDAEPVDDPTPAFDDAVPEIARTLTPAEQRVFTLLLGGLAEKEIARRLRLSPHTVRNHVKRIYATHRVNSRSELLALFIDPPPPPAQ